MSSTSTTQRFCYAAKAQGRRRRRLLRCITKRCSANSELEKTWPYLAPDLISPSLPAIAVRTSGFEWRAYDRRLGVKPPGSGSVRSWQEVFAQQSPLPS